MNSLIKNKHLALFSLCFIVFLDFLSYGLIIPVINKLFLSPEQSFLPFEYSENLRFLLLGIVTSAYPAAQFFGAPVIGALSDKYGRKKMLTLTLTGSVIANLAFVAGMLFSSTTIMVIGRLVGGFMGGNAALANTMVGDISENNEKSRNYGFIGLAMAVGIVLGPYLGAQLADPNFIPNASIRTPFYFAAGLSAFAVFCVVLFLKETIHESINRKADFFAGFHQIFRSMQYSNLRVIFSITLGIVLSFNIFAYSLNIFLQQKIGFNEKDLGNFLAYAGICLTIALGFINPLVAKKFKIVQILKISLFALTICFFWSLIPKTYVGIYILTPFLALAYGLSQANIAALLSNNTDKDEHGEAFGVNQSLTSFVEGITPLFTTFLLSFNSLLPQSWDYTLPTIFAGLAALSSWVIFMFYFVFKPHPEIKH